MKATRIFLVAALAFVVANCADRGPLGVTADQPASGAVATVTTGPQSDLLGGLLQGLGLLKCTPLAPATATANIGPRAARSGSARTPSRCRRARSRRT